MSFVAVAIGGGAVAGLGSAFIGANAAKDAASTQAQAGQNALNFQKGVFDQQQANYSNASDYIKSTLSPYINAGTGAAGTLSRITGGNGTPADFSSFYNSPDFTFAQKYGATGLQNYENANGLALSGGALKDVAQFNQGLATQQYGNYFNRLMQLAQLGGGSANAAAGGIGSLTGGFNNAAGVMSGQIGNTIQGIGQANASGTIGTANAWMGGLQNAGNSAILGAALSNPSAYKNLSGNLSNGFTSFLSNPRGG